MLTYFYSILVNFGSCGKTFYVCLSFFFFKLKFIRTTIVSKVIYISGVQFCNTWSTPINTQIKYDSYDMTIFFLKVDKLILNPYRKINKIEDLGNNEKTKIGVLS